MSDGGIPWYKMRHWGLEQWRLAVTAIQALAGWTVAGLAIWGVLFTSLPESIIRHLRADATDAREELIEVRSARNRAAQDVERLKEEQAQLQSDIQRLSSERERYLAAARGHELVIASRALNERMMSYRRANEAARTLLGAVQWDNDIKQFLKNTEGMPLRVRIRRWEQESAEKYVAGKDTSLSDMYVLMSVSLDREKLPEPRSVYFASAFFDTTVKALRDHTPVNLLLEQLAQTNSLTPSDGLLFRKDIELQMRKSSLLTQTLLVDATLIRGGGVAAEQELQRASSVFKAFDDFVMGYYNNLRGIP